MRTLSIDKLSAGCSSLLQNPPPGTLLQFVNCRLYRDATLGPVGSSDLWLCDGIVLNPIQVFYGLRRRPDARVDCRGLILSPGFIDVQVNGAFGVDFTSCPSACYQERFASVARQLLRYGITAFCPTIISAQPTVYRRVLPLLNKSTDQEPAGAKFLGTGLLGFHTEGPFISQKKPGCHPTANITNFGPVPSATIEEVYSVDGLRNISMVTIAPELHGSREAIHYFTSKGIQVSLGHTDADLEEASLAVKAGANGLTHLFNAMRSFQHRGDRGPGPLGLLASTPLRSSVYYGIIVDGIHVHDSAVQIAYTLHPDGMILVTDCMAGLGLTGGICQLGEQSVELRDGVAYIHDTDTVAGSTARMNECVSRLATLLKPSSIRGRHEALERALKCATINPARFLKIDTAYGSLEEGRKADFVLIDDDVNVSATFINGRLCYSSFRH